MPTRSGPLLSVWILTCLESILCNSFEISKVVGLILSPYAPIMVAGAQIAAGRHWPTTRSGSTCHLYQRVRNELLEAPNSSEDPFSPRYHAFIKELQSILEINVFKDESKHRSLTYLA